MKGRAHEQLLMGSFGPPSPVEYLFAELTWREEATGLTVVDESRLRVGQKWTSTIPEDVLLKLYRLDLIDCLHPRLELTDFGYGTMAYRIYYANVRANAQHPATLEAVEAHMLFPTAVMPNHHLMLVLPFLRPPRNTTLYAPSETPP
jgi:hypothetical protein